MVKDWNTIDLETYLEILDIKADSTISYNMELLAIIEDLDIYSDSFLDLDIDEIEEKLTRYKFIRQLPIPVYKDKINDMSLKPMTTITLGEWIDLDKISSDLGLKGLAEICAILYRKTKTDEWDNTVYEPYIYDYETRIELFYNQPVSNCYYVYDEWIKFRTMILTEYEHLFRDPDEESEEFETEYLSEAEIESIKKEIENDKYESQFGWQYLLLEIAENDFNKALQILALPLLYIFNLLTVKRRAEKKSNITNNI